MAALFSHVANVVYYHIRFVTMGILVVGGVACLVIFLLLFSSSADDQTILPPEGENVSVSDEAIDRIFASQDLKKRQQSAVPAILNGSFFTPPPSL
jgi:hypothetical protein